MRMEAGQAGLSTSTWVQLAFLGFLWGGYLMLRFSARVRSSWPWNRSVFWSLGILAATAATIGPIPDRAPTDFRLHMVGHLAIGMLAPIGLVLAAPVTLILRALPQPAARWTVHRLESRLLRLLTHPCTAVILSVGGFWLLMTTSLLAMAHRNAWLGALINLHMLAVGYLFTAAIIGIDPVRRRPSRQFRAVVLMLALAAHDVLAKWIYAHPPAGIASDQAHGGARLMYYGGDAIEGLVIIIFCWQWFRATSPRPAPVKSQATRPVLAAAVPPITLVARLPMNIR